MLNLLMHYSIKLETQRLTFQFHKVTSWEDVPTCRDGYTGDWYVAAMNRSAMMMDKKSLFGIIMVRLDFTNMIQAFFAKIFQI
ncbi:hypothetical protein M8J76_005658 [Diaphorina citri]|nr:hypothetical protein M8J76_005658 [Diaphorina citri]